jgi:hypothetical protein
MIPNFSSKKCLNPSDISSSLQNNRLVRKLADSDESELSNIDESNESAYIDKKEYVLSSESGNDDDEDCSYEMPLFSVEG